jgi:hypothetical protein
VIELDDHPHSVNVRPGLQQGEIVRVERNAHKRGSTAQRTFQFKFRFPTTRLCRIGQLAAQLIASDVVQGRPTPLA